MGSPMANHLAGGPVAVLLGTDRELCTAASADYGCRGRLDPAGFVQRVQHEMDCGKSPVTGLEVLLYARKKSALRIPLPFLCVHVVVHDTCRHARREGGWAGIVK